MVNSPRQIGDISVLREEGSVKIELEYEDGGEDAVYLPPESAVQVAMWLQQAASDCKQYKQSASK